MKKIIAALALATLAASASAADGKIRFKKESDGFVQMKAIINHPMDNGLAKDQAGKPIPAKYIAHVVVSVDGKVVSEQFWSGGVSKNPFMSINLGPVKAGSKVRIDTEENTGAKDFLEATID